MKATGIVRRIDDLGRVVIPKEIRRIARIKEGDPLEIFIDKDGGVTFKKYSYVKSLVEYGAAIIESLAKELNAAVLLTDTDMILEVSRCRQREFKEKRITEELDRIIRNRQAFTASDSSKIISVTNDQECTFSNQIVVPISITGDPAGSIILLSNEKLGDIELKAAEICASILAKELNF